MSKGSKSGSGRGSKGGVRSRAGASPPSARSQTIPSTPRFSGSEFLQGSDNVSRETLNRLQIYSSLLAHWQKTINLVAPSTLDQIWERHFADSAQLLDRAPASARVWVDLGSGAGFPGLVIAILLAGRVETGAAEGRGAEMGPGVGRAEPAPAIAAKAGAGAGEARQLGDMTPPDNVSRETFEAEAPGNAVPAAVGLPRSDRPGTTDAHGPAQPDLQGASREKPALPGSPAPHSVILIESDSRKCAFLAEVVRKTGISCAITVEILNRRIENPETRATVGVVDVISARALAPLERLLAWSAPLMSAHTMALFLKGRDAPAEIEEARRKWTFACRSWPSRTDTFGKILEIQNVRPMRKDELP